MQLSFSTSGLLVWGLLTGLSAAAPAAQDIEKPTPPRVTLPGGPIPSTCTKDDVGVSRTPSCYTHTVTTTPTSCFTTKCPGPTVYCPQYIKITTLPVPCSTDCCPHTPTQTVTASCPGCVDGCVIPTQTVTVTTGCKTQPSIITPTATIAES